MLLYVTEDPDYMDCQGRERKNVGPGIGVGFGALFMLIGLWWLYKVFTRRNEKQRKKYFLWNGGLLLQEKLSSGEVHVGKIKLFTSKELDNATDHYNVNRMLGQGGWLMERSLQTEVPLLVSEFIPNGTLSQFLHYPNEELPLTWEMRLGIATEVAGALSYLQSAASIPIYHRDIKLISQLWYTVHGTFGYLDTEYFQSSQFTDKSDVYSFGVVLVELLTGQKAVSFSRSDDEARSLVTYFLMSIEDNRLSGILDPQVKVQGRKEDIMMVAVLAKSCLSMKGKESVGNSDR
eukprot:XP_024445365.1 putative wall-associated receptor kinase-like 11 [Populus trichocarpa]